MNPLVKLAEFGQSVWFDNISRKMINENELKNLVENEGVRGVTSNPSIFQKAIAKSNDYDEQLTELLKDNPEISNLHLFEALAVKDIQNAADILYPVYKSSNKIDGYVSLEVSPDLAYKTKETILNARKLFRAVGKENVMIKIPATEEGLPAIKQMISEGVNINVTLIFSLDVYKKVVEAFLAGLEKRLSQNLPIDGIASVASFFISRIDSAVDKELEAKGNKSLQGKIAIDNAKVVYQVGKEIFESERFKKLKDAGAQPQRLLWASTSTKNPSYPDTLYVEELIGKDTVNTMPPDTVIAYRDHGKPEDRIELDVESSRKNLTELNNIGINFSTITDELTKVGVELFATSFLDLLSAIEEKKNKILSTIKSDIIFHLDEKTNAKVEAKLKELYSEELNYRLFAKDFTLWKDDKKDDVELSNRLGWLNLPEVMLEKVEYINSIADDIKTNFDYAVLLGMGGSSLAPELFFKIFGKKEGYPELLVLDSTHPEAVKRILNKVNLEKTVFIVASKSGGTTETMSFFYTFYDCYKDNAGSHFIALTDPGSGLEKLSKEKNFRHIVSTPPEVGGRFSALTEFGLLPAAIIGVDIKLLLQKALTLNIESKLFTDASSIKLGVLAAQLAVDENKNKITFITSKTLNALPDWIEQLVAESTGKEGKGILPISNEIVDDLSFYSNDRLFVSIKLEGEETSTSVESLLNKGFNVVEITLNDKIEIGKEFYRWEVATAVMGVVLNLNPFDQPNVQLAKTLANEAMKEFKEKGKLKEEQPVIAGDINVYGNADYSSAEKALDEFLHSASEGNYIALMGFVDPSKETQKALDELQKSITKKYKIPVTKGLGPRFLHSTGQLHKGDDNSGYFVQFTADVKDDMEVPGQGYSFGTLILAQAQGDYNALKNTGRKLIRFHFKDNPAEGIKKLL